MAFQKRAKECDVDASLREMIAQIEANVAADKVLPWNSPFVVGTLGKFVNCLHNKDFHGNQCPDGRPYNGFVNWLFLFCCATNAQRRTGSQIMENRFVPYSKCQAKYGKGPNKFAIHPEVEVRKDAVPCHVFVPMMFKRDNSQFDHTKPVSTKNSPTLSFFTGKFTGGRVYNLSDTNLVELGLFLPKKKPVEVERATVDELEEKICGYPQKYVAELCVPHYSPVTKEIHTPSIGFACDTVAYYSTRAHELVHQLQDMCGDLKGRFDRESYSVHELEAEFGATIIMSSLGYVKAGDAEFVNSAAYIQTWLSRIKENPSILLESARKADRYARLILSGALPGQIVNREAFSYLPAESEVEVEMEAEVAVE